MSRTASGTVSWRGNPPRWWARVTVKGADGVVHRPWVDLERPDLKNTPEDKRAAKRLALKRAKLASKKGSFVGVERATAPRVTLEDLEDKWYALLDGDTHLKSGTRTAYKSCFGANVLPRLGKHPVASLNVPTCRAWIRELAAELSPSSVRNNAISLTRFLSDARAEGWIALDSNPMKHENVRAVLPSVRAPDPDAIVYWTRAECEKLLASPLPHDRFGLYLVALLTGLRAGELRGLTFAHLVLDGPAPHMRVRQQQTLQRYAGEAAATGTPKTRSSKRDVPLHPAAGAWLSWWRDAGWASTYERARADADPVFPAIDGEAGRPRDANILRRDLTKAGMPLEFVGPDGSRDAFTFHAFRRSFARLLGDSGVDMNVIGMLAGHAAETVTQAHYAGRSMETMARAIAGLRLALPNRPGVISSPLESSHESSQPKEASATAPENDNQFKAFTYEQPIELPQFRHL